jgi:hypothetical protein
MFVINGKYTVESLTMKKSKSKSEYERQISIAQNFVDWIHEFHIVVDPGNRVNDILALPNRSVKDWAMKDEVNK